MKYSDLKLKTNTKTNIAKLADGTEIEVLEYLPVEDKIDLIQIALQKSMENGIYNDIKLDMYFNLYIIYMYTNIEFTPEERNDEFKLYNELESNDIILSVIGAMREEEYNSLLNYLETIRDNNTTYKMSAAALFQSFIQDLPKNAQAAADMVDHFDKDKYQEVIDFAKAANGGRPV